MIEDLGKKTTLISLKGKTSTNVLVYYAFNWLMTVIS